jgi:hypothetical protein
LQYDGGGFRIGALSMTFAGMDNQRYDLELSTDAQNRLVLTSGGKSFPFGPRLSPPDPAGRPEIDFAPDPGDELSFTFERSWLSWPVQLRGRAFAQLATASVLPVFFEEAIRSDARNVVALRAAVLRRAGLDCAGYELQLFDWPAASRNRSGALRTQPS